MPRMIAERVEFTQGQTEPITFKLYTSKRATVDLTGATLKLSLWRADTDDEVWDFSATNAALTHDNTEVTWTPASASVFEHSGLYLAQIEITWGSGNIEYWPRDFHDWAWIVYPKTTD